MEYSAFGSAVAVAETTAVPLTGTSTGAAMAMVLKAMTRPTREVENLIVKMFVKVEKLRGLVGLVCFDLRRWRLCFVLEMEE
jgi:hypothetical protein